MKKSDISRLRELVDLCEGHECYKAWLGNPYWWDFNTQVWILNIQLDGEILKFRDEHPWIMADWPELNWQGDYFFHRSCAGVYLVQGTTRDFNGSIYRPRLRAFKTMVRWARPETEVGFTIWHTVKEHWGYMLVWPWLIKSTDPVWLQRIKMFSALNTYDPTRWPMSLLIEKWSDFREIGF